MQPDVIQILHSRLIVTQVYQPYAHKELKLVLPTSRSCGQSNSFNYTTVQLYPNTDFKPKVSNILKDLCDTETWVSLTLCKSKRALLVRGQGHTHFWEKKIDVFWKYQPLILLFQALWDADKVLAMRKIMTVLNNCLANRISINSYSHMPCSHLLPTNCNMTIRSPGLYWHVRKWLWTQSFLRSKGCPTFHNDVGEQKSLRSSNGLQGRADNKHSLIKLFEKVRLPLVLLWEQKSSWFIAIQCPSFLILM